METGEKSQLESQEQEATSKVVLHFFRHSEKKSDPSAQDKDIELTASGKKLAKEKSPSKNIRQSVAYGSPRKRAQETAGFVMAGQEDEITGEETLEELKEKLDKDIAVGSKIGIDSRLDFNDDDTTEYGKKFSQAFDDKKLLDFLVNQSDALADQLGDKEASTYSRGASNIASIVKKYITIAPRWDKLANDESKEYNDTLERFLGTHQTVSESFLAKVIEKTKGAEERNKFVESLNSAGFSFVEGFDVEINNIGDNQEIHITFHKEKGDEVLFDYNETVPIEIIDQILEEGAIKE